jgi:hypothetical protein
VTGYLLFGCQHKSESVSWQTIVALSEWIPVVSALSAGSYRFKVRDECDEELLAWAEPSPFFWSKTVKTMPC